MLNQPAHVVAYSVPVHPGYTAQGGRHGSEPLRLNPAIQEHIRLDDGSALPAPKQSKMVVSKPRLCGDWYAECEGVGYHVAVTGSTRDDAIRAAFAKAR